MRVICELPNAGRRINGVEFEPLEGGGMLSESLTPEQAAAFLAIPGYKAHPDRDVSNTPAGTKKDKEPDPINPAEQADKEPDPINMNSASAEEIHKRVRGIGLKTAQAVVAEREKNGPFADAKDLADRVRGVGLHTLQANASENISFEEEA